ncbi:phosphatase PAP2 family protein [Actinocrinis puniceicyclus]|uniref:Phosphatase PAP2 family protein n=1 Tax=Actinocrinis puniceicyclus TaxID=977794 RepID=A0A8J8BDK1_9ACTN|nr:phosphatase PAP2 family protein [Actinocrinis puniceicyclus]MBS2966322.1 phosphatase PAP2 family protein [Actinocrinis puniceicyclus]
MTATAAVAPAAVSTVTSADDGWYRDITSFAQHTAYLHALMTAYTTASFGLLGLLALYAWWRARRNADRTAMAAVAWTGIGTAVAVAAGLALKQVFAEARPCLAMHVATVQPCPGPTDYSFPSDHTTVAVALAAGLLLAERGLGLIAAALALLEGFSRVYLGQHYPHDVAAGLILSVLILMACWPLVRRPLIRLLAVLETTRLRPVLTTGPMAVPEK